ncbi:MAG: cell division protein FtsA [Alphaproteobacteria bacterium]|nr:cell division protein FtsA [Alphaproteobacteria bacterium]
MEWKSGCPRRTRSRRSSVSSAWRQTTGCCRANTASSICGCRTSFICASGHQRPSRCPARYENDNERRSSVCTGVDVAKTRNGVVAALDIGTSKVVCFIARVYGQGLRVVGIGHQAALGMRSGNIVDMEAATRAISSAVSTGEEMCGEHVREVIVGVSGGSPASHNQSLEVMVGHHEIGERDIRRGQQLIQLPAETADRDIIHSQAIGYSVDGTPVRDARGMFGERLGVDVHLVTAQSGAMRNLQVCVRRAHLEIADRVTAAHASGLSSLVADERDLGVTLIDMGGGTTSIAVFYEGNLVHVDSIPVGGDHVTRDIARGLSTPVAHAERMKTQIGRAVAKPNDEYDIIDVPLIGEEERTRPNHVPRSILVGIIRPRIEETFELVRSRLEASGVDKLAGGRAVLVGGASLLDGVPEVAGAILNKKVRVGAPLRLAGLADSTGGPAFSAAAGLLAYAQMQHAATQPASASQTEAPRGRIGRIGSWIRENF